MDDHLIDHSMRSSRVREDLLISGAVLKKAHLALLAEHAGVTARAAKMALHGRLPHYREDLSLVELGLFAEVPKLRGRAYTITPLGLRRARQALAERRRAAARALAEAPRLHGQRRARRGQKRRF